jgi:hypothetical protein
VEVDRLRAGDGRCGFYALYNARKMVLDIQEEFEEFVSECKEILREEMRNHSGRHYPWREKDVESGTGYMFNRHSYIYVRLCKSHAYIYVLKQHTCIHTYVHTSHSWIQSTHGTA